MEIHVLKCFHAKVTLHSTVKHGTYRNPVVFRILVEEFKIFRDCEFVCVPISLQEYTLCESQSPAHQWHKPYDGFTIDFRPLSTENVYDVILD